MSYAMAQGLQSALFQRLTGDPALTALVGDAIYDALPGGTLPETYVLLGDEEARDASDQTGAGAVHEVTIGVVSRVAGFADAKAAAGAVSDALLSGPPMLERGRIVGLWFLKARARRSGAGDERRIDLQFRARTEDD
ncbi:hypothetical protein LCGC14_2147490 [marine sediment metagenome]|uniref:Gene transfer agent protein n=1 Tax=marine sediment metagenome TaxID=412755 RepID=A0A0F9EIP6_9ZZZZ